jgi:hypothetical protein
MSMSDFLAWLFLSLIVLGGVIYVDGLFRD